MEGCDFGGVGCRGSDIEEWVFDGKGDLIGETDQRVTKLEDGE
jgi:hypothetical protein